MTDNWKHRSEGMRCKTCMFFVPKVPKSLNPCFPKNPEESPREIKPQGIIDLGRCRRNAPTLSGWPAVFVNDWCGDHKLDEEKLPCPK